jgi:MurNAc alpha-1-phosphate uridylyltransferase
MKAMILAAGRGERMRPLTDDTPKPLLKVAGKPLIQYTIEKLVAAGFEELVINLSYRGQQLRDYLGDGRQFNCRIDYSEEGETPLETAGGIIHALPLLGKQPFLLINGDIASDYPLARLLTLPVKQAHLIMMSNPPHHPEGDFHLNEEGVLQEQGDNQLTYSGIGLFNPALFKDLPQGSLKLGPVLRSVMAEGQITGEKYSGFWMDIGTPERLHQLAQRLSPPPI